MTDVAKPGLNLRMGPIAFALLLKGLVETLRLGPGLFEPRRPGTGCLIALVAWWRRITPRADIKQQPPNGAEIVRQQIAELLVQIKDARAHREKMLPAAQLHLPARQLVIAIDDRRVERRDQRGMQEVEEIGDRWSQAFDRSEEHTSELQSLMRIPYAVFCLQKKNI